VDTNRVKLPLWQIDPDPKIVGRKASYVLEVFINIHKFNHKGDKHVHESEDWWGNIHH
jgi:hypothetical protein